MASCTFCEKNIPKGTGIMFVKKDGKMLFFCSRKCEKNLLKLKRKARNVAWTEEARRVKQVGLATLEHKKEEEKAAKKKESKKAEKN